MTDLFGFTRNVIKERYALLAPSGFVPSYLPGWEKAVCNVLISPGMGALFCQMLITLERDGRGAGNTGVNQYFFYVMSGSAGFVLGDKRHRIEAGNYVYVPAGQDMQIESSAAGTRLLVFQKRYVPLPGTKKPGPIVAHEKDVKGQPFLGNDDARLQVLLPDQPAYDMAVNIFTYQSGATLPFVETHIMEHGLLMLSGQGIYQLDGDWYPVQAGDIIWMAPYCPQWFVAMGKTPASYIYYKDVNREPL